jgi:hypothetical protein
LAVFSAKVVNRWPCIIQLIEKNLPITNVNAQWKRIHDDSMQDDDYCDGYDNDHLKNKSRTLQHRLSKLINGYYEKTLS